MKSLANVGFNPAEASILLSAARRLSNLGLIKIDRVGPDWRGAATRTRLGDRLVAGRQVES